MRTGSSRILNVVDYASGGRITISGSYYDFRSSAHHAGYHGGNITIEGGSSYHNYGGNLFLYGGDILADTLDPGKAGDVIISGGNTAKFSEAGKVEISGGFSKNNNGGNIKIVSGESLNFDTGSIDIKSASTDVDKGDSSGEVMLATGDASTNDGAVGILKINGGNFTKKDSSHIGDGGEIKILSGMSDNGKGGDISITAGFSFTFDNAAYDNLDGGSITIRSGNMESVGARNDAGDINIVGGDAIYSRGGDILLSGGGGINGGALSFQGGIGSSAQGGSITFETGIGEATDSGQIQLKTSNAGSAGVSGDIMIQSGVATAGASGQILISSGIGGVSGESGAVVITSGNTGDGNTGEVQISSGSATGGTGGAISLTVGSSSTSNGGSITLSAGTADISGGNIYLKPGNASTGGSVYFVNPANGLNYGIISESSFSFSLLSAASITAAGSIDLSSSSIITLTATNGISMGDSYVYDFETSSGVVGSTTPDELIIHSMSGVITSETSDLGSGSEDTFRLWNSRVYSTSMVFANIASSSDCVLMVSNLLTGTNYVDVTVYNSGGSACTSTYTLNFFVVN